MSKLEALKELEGKVVADLATAHNFAAVWPSENGYGKCTWHDAHKADGGSLDAAKALHEAVLPGWGWDANRQSVCVQDDKGHKFYGQKRSRETLEGGALWLLAIVRALIAIEEDK